MSAPRLSPFRERLAAALESAAASGRMSDRSYEELLIDPGFDAAEFEAFRAEAVRRGVALPESDAETPPADLRAAAGEPERDLLDLYLTEIGRVPLMTHAELVAAARRARAGDERARRAMILANLRLVVFLARDYRTRGLPMLDLIEEGNLGLIHAVDRFDPDRGARFSTFAAIAIRQAMLRGIAEQSRAVRIPVQVFQQAQRFVGVERALRTRLGREPAVEEIARELDISPARAERLAGLVGAMRPTDERSGIDAYEQLSAYDPSEPPLSVERMVELQLEHEHVDRLLRTLSQREEQVLRIRYGFHDGVARTLQQTGEHFGITRERVRQIESRALARLRQAIELEELDRATGGTVQ